jgi:hypothetical protein
MVRDDTSCYIDQSKWINLIQDKGIAIVGTRCMKGYRRARNKASRTGEAALQYKELNEAATMLFDLYESKIEYFDIKLKRKADGITTIMGWIVDKRERDIMAVKSVTRDNVPRAEFFPVISQWNKNGEDGVYLMDQTSILIEAFSVWGRNETKVKPNGPNDFIRMIAIMLHPDNRDNMDVINDERKTRADLDDPSRSKNSIFENIAGQMTSDNVYPHPQRWMKIHDENLENKHMIDPNDSNVKRKIWSGVDIKMMYDYVLKKYRESMVKWTKGTGGGHGAPENYEDWETRNDEWFHNYGSATEFIPWLTWVYCMDQECGGILLAKYEGLPSGIGTEDGTSVHRETSRSSKQMTMIGAVTEVMKGLQNEMKSIYRDTVQEQLSFLKTISSNNEDNVYLLNEQFEKAHETYVQTTMSIIKEAADLHPFELLAMKRKRNDCHTMMKKLKIDLQKHGIEKTIEEYPDDQLPHERNSK